MAIAVLSKNGERLMPTECYGKVRNMLKDGRAVIVKHRPFTIQLTYETSTYTQPIELCVDAGYQHVGISVKSEKKEYVSAQYDLLKDEKEKHDTQRMYRRQRRSRKRYRKPRFNNRTASKKDGWLAPSIRNKMETHVRLIQEYTSAMPVTDIYIEVGQFDTMKLKAIEEGREIPEGKDYQQGPRYNLETLREAVFVRDKHTCQFCKRNSFKDGAVLHVHHMLFWKGRHGNSLSELVTVCEKCHTPKNHKEGGLLWGKEVKMARLEGSAFMNAVRWQIVSAVKAMGIPVHVTYGAETKASRTNIGIDKNHVNDAYAMGSFRPAKRDTQKTYQKKRRNNRCLEKFYDAKYIDSRTGKTVSGQELFSGRSKRNKNLNDENLHKCRKEKKSKGKRSIRRQRYPLQPGDVVLYKGRKAYVKGTHNNGTRAILDTGKSVSLKELTIRYHVSGWKEVS